MSIDTPQGLIIPENGDEFEDLVRITDSHFGGVHDDLHTIAATLRHGLANPVNKNGEPLGGRMSVDLKMNAWRVARHIAHAAGAQHSSRKAVRTAYETYRELYTGQRVARPRSGGFTVT